MDNLTDFYHHYFNRVKEFGLLAYRIDKKTQEVTYIKSGFPYYFQIFNTCFLITMCLRTGIMLAVNVMAPNTSELTISVQLVFLFGVAMLTTIGGTQLWFAEEIASLFSALIQLEKKLDTRDSPLLVKKKKSWMRLRFLQIQLTRYVCLAAFIVYTPLVIFVPRFPSETWNIGPDPVEDHFWETPLLARLIGLGDVYLVPIGWLHMWSFDLLLGIISSQISYYLKVILEMPPDSKEGLKGFKGVQILITIINDALAVGIILHMALMALTILCLLYGFVSNKEGSILAAIFLLTNFLGCVARLMILLIPIADLQIQADKALEHFEQTLDKESIVKREIWTLRTFCISAGGIYKIDIECVFHFINFLISYFVVIST